MFKINTRNKSYFLLPMTKIYEIDRIYKLYAKNSFANLQDARKELRGIEHLFVIVCLTFRKDTGDLININII